MSFNLTIIDSTGSASTDLTKPYLYYRVVAAGTFHSEIMICWLLVFRASCEPFHNYAFHDA